MKYAPACQYSISGYGYPGNRTHDVRTNGREETGAVSVEVIVQRPVCDFRYSLLALRVRE